jgi:membrane associated rhomboid family serine protease
MIPIKDDVPSRTFPFVTVTLIVVNALVFLYEFSLGPHLESFIRHWGATPVFFAQMLGGAEVVNNHGEIVTPLAPPLLTLFTSMFLHGGWLHLIGNMWYLWIFGDNVEDAMGHFRYIVFYLLAGVVSGLTQVVTSPHSTIPALGASGAIAGVLGAYLILYPKASVLTIIPLGWYIQTVRLPALLVLGLWFVIQLFYGLASLPGAGQTGGVAFFAHIGGFVAGLVLVKLFQKRNRRFVAFDQ